MMKRERTGWLRRHATPDWGLFALRMLLGAIILLHNVLRMQHCTVLLDHYPTWGFLPQATSFVFVVTLEVLCAVLIMMGFYVRWAAGAMAVTQLVRIIMYLQQGEWSAVELPSIYLIIMLFLLVAGGGAYAIDRIFPARRTESKAK